MSDGTGENPGNVFLDQALLIRATSYDRQTQPNSEAEIGSSVRSSVTASENLQDCPTYALVCLTALPRLGLAPLPFDNSAEVFSERSLVTSRASSQWGLFLEQDGHKPSRVAMLNVAKWLTRLDRFTRQAQSICGWILLVTRKIWVIIVDDGVSAVIGADHF